MSVTIWRASYPARRKGTRCSLTPTAAAAAFDISHAASTISASGFVRRFLDLLIPGRTRAATALTHPSRAEANAERAAVSAPLTAAEGRRGW